MRALRILGMILGGLVALIIVLILGIYINAQRQLGARFNNPVTEVTVARTPDQVTRGAYLVGTFGGCVGCHSSNLTANPPVLDGSHLAELADLGDFNAPNLTPAGPIKDWSDGQLIRAIREGIDADGRPL